MKQETRNKINALVNQIEEEVRAEVTVELTEKLLNRKKPGPVKGSKRTPKVVSTEPAPTTPETASATTEPVRDLPKVEDPPAVDKVG